MLPPGRLRTGNTYNPTLRAPNVLHLLASLIAQANQLLPTAVADARDQECTWAEIGDLLGVTRASAWQHYGGKTPPNRTPTQPD